MRRDNDDRLIGYTILGFVLVVIFMLWLKCWAAAKESEVYNRLTGAHTTWWDAMWVELRVQDKPKQE